MQPEEQETFLDRNPNPFWGAHQLSPVQEGTVVKVNTDDETNVTFTADVITPMNEQKKRVPFLFQYASAAGDAGVFSVPQVGDKCLIALVAGNQPYIIGYHPSAQAERARASALLARRGESPRAVKGTFARTQLLPGGTEIRGPAGNRVLVHPSGSIAIDSRTDLFSFYNAVSGSLTHFSRSYFVFTAGGSIRWGEGQEKAQRSMKLSGEFFTKSATTENVDAGPLRGGARMSLLFEDAIGTGSAPPHFLLDISNEDVSNRISIGPGGISLTSQTGSTTSILTIGGGGQQTFIAGDPNGLHTQLDLSPEAVAITALSGPTTLATVIADTSGSVTVSSQSQITVNAPVVQTSGITQLALGGPGVVRSTDIILVPGVQAGGATAVGRAATFSAQVGAGT